VNIPDGWSKSATSLDRVFTFPSFSVAIDFMTRVSRVCEELDHHPDWSNSWNVVRVSLTTHSAGLTVTDKDLELAARMNAVFSEFD
jgi:4a-hydroxytetrahydrobiopterin dehydratase